MSSQLNNLASEIVLAKSAASAATAKVTRLLNDVYSIKSFNLDISNNILNLNNQINNLNNILQNLDSYNDISRIDLSINDIYSTINSLLINSNIQDNSFQELNFYISDLSNNLYSIINNKFTTLDNSLNGLNDIDITLQNYDISLTQLIEDVRDICGSVFLEKIRDISGDVIELESNITNISGQLSNIINTINNLDISYVSDVSFEQFKLQLSNIVDASFVSDNSFNNLQNNIDSNLSFLSGQDVLLKNDLNFNASLIDNNNTYTQRLENKLNNLVNILNSQTNLNLNININTL